MTKEIGFALLIMGIVGCGPDLSQLPTIRMEIARGMPLGAVAESLEARQFITSASKFKLYARITGNAGAIQAGIYELPVGATNGQILRLLTSGQVASDRLSIPEGLMLSEVADAVESQLGVPAESIWAAAHDPSRIQALGIDAPNLEGYLYPSTHVIRAGASAGEIVDQMTNEFLARWRPSWDERARQLGLTRHEVVTLASIIEGEVGYKPDGPYISSVYHNRLRVGMRLQADPTVIYALGRRRRLFERDYLTRSPYNTYVVDGLPPAPIGQPSEASIEAALYPERTDFFYIVADTSGKHVFSRTYGEHLAAVRRIRVAQGRG
ncbi:MAG: endolytic transglycosylase MltG [Gemmatimonadetes bacterium]|nr:endolytic transglycosylase MltG [Gemmatimonadota bacterium]